MVSSMLHMARGNAEVFACAAAFAATVFLLRMYSRRPAFLLWVLLSIQPIMWIPDSTAWAAARVEALLPGVAPAHVFAAIVAVALTAIVAGLLRKPREPKYDVDSTKLDSKDNFKHVYAGPTLTTLDPFFAELRTCYDSGVSKPLAKRREQLLALRAFVVENEKAITQALHEDLGRPLFEGLFYDVFMLVSEIDSALKQLAEWAAPRPVGASVLTWPSTQWLQEEPLGVVLVVSCWNFPVQLALSPVIGALAAGNVVALKPSLTSPATGKLLREVLPKYMDPRVLSVVGPFACSDIECSQAILKHRFDYIFFTGSARGGRAVMEAAAKHVTPCTMELGGKNPVFVTADADIDLAAKRTVWGRMLNAGQQCIAPDYVLCDQTVLDKFAARCKYWVDTMYGEDAKTNGNIGKINATQTDRIISIVSSHGGRVIAGGKFDRAANFVEPTVVVVDQDSPLLKDETFGPILAITAVKSVDEAIKYVNAREKPLALYVFSSIKSVQDRIVRNTSSGGVTVNATLFHAGHPLLPFGGVGNSGFGAYHGKYSFSTFSHAKPVLVKATWPDLGLLTDPFFLYPPFSTAKVAILRQLSKVM